MIGAAKESSSQSLPISGCAEPSWATASTAPIAARSPERQCARTMALAGRDARERRRLAIAADGQKPPTDRQAKQKQREQRGDDERRDQQERERPDPAIAEILQRMRHLVERHRFGEARG